MSCQIVDSFTRTVSDGWGSADLGGAYTLGWPAWGDGVASHFSVTGAAGRIAIPPGFGDSPKWATLTASLGDVEVTGTFTPFEGGGSGSRLVRALVILRYTSPTQYYAIQLDRSSSGWVRLTPLRQNSTIPGIGNGPSSAVPWVLNTSVRYRLRITDTPWGAHFEGRAWALGDVEPAVWELDEYDASPLTVPGGVGLGVSGFASNAVVGDSGVLHDDFCVVGPAPTRRPFAWII